MDDVATQALRIVGFVSGFLIIIAAIIAFIYFGRRYWRTSFLPGRNEAVQLKALKSQVERLESEIENLRTTVQSINVSMGTRFPSGGDTFIDRTGIEDRLGQFFRELQVLAARYATASEVRPSSGNGRPMPEVLPRPVREPREPVTHTSILSWWKREGHQGFSRSLKSLGDEFDCPDIELVHPEDNSGERDGWNVIAIKTQHDKYLLLPRRKANWINDVFEKYYSLQEQGTIREGARISSIKRLSFAEKTGHTWVVIGNKGVVSISD